MTDLLGFLDVFLTMLVTDLVAACDVRVFRCDTSFNGRDDFRLALVLITTGGAALSFPVFSTLVIGATLE